MLKVTLVENNVILFRLKIIHMIIPMIVRLFVNSVWMWTGMDLKLLSLNKHCLILISTDGGCWFTISTIQDTPDSVSVPPSASNN